MANEGYSILDVINDEYGVILTRNGCVSVAFRMYNPECYSLHRTDLEERNARLYQAFKHLPSGSFVHKQDVFLKREYVHELEGDSFIDKAEQRHFSGREYLEHDCLLIFTLSGLSSLAASYNANPFSYRERLHVSDREKLTEFLEGVNSAIGVINSIRDTRLERMAAASLREYVIRYINFFPRADCDRDIHFSGEITVDREKARCYTVCDGDYLPDRTVRSDVEDTTLPVSGCSLYMAELEGLGVHLHCNHAVNQILYFEGSEKLYEEFSRRVAVYRTNKGWDRAMLEPKADELENMQKEIMEERQLLCRANFSVMIWDDSPELLDRAEKKLREYLTVSDFKFYIPSYEHLANIYLASVPGQEKGLDSGFLFLTPLSLALCLFINYTTFTPDEEGVYFNDRIYQIPLKKDIWDAKKKRIPARNGIVVASTGGGKSVLTLNIVQQLIEQHLANIYLASVPGQEKGLDSGFLFLTPLSLALCLFINYTTFTPDEEGVYFNDRIYQIPLKKDIWDAKKKRIPARNGIVVASTGGGKSVLTLNIVQQLIEQGYIVVVVEFGYSFGQLCKLYPGISLHVDYDGETPLGLNPFDLEGRSLDNNKIEVLSGIVQRFWRRMFGKDEEEQSVALTKFIQDYYATCLPPHSFPSFYRHVTEHYEDICRRKDVDPNYFDLSSFRLICSEFLPGERYANVCRTDGVPDFGNRRLVVFELTQIKQDKFLSDLVMALIFDVIHDKILSDRTRRGMIIFDEYAETAQMKSRGEDISIHSAVAFCYQKIRKENGAVMTIVQSPDQLPDDEFTKGMITNTQLLYILPTTDVVYRAVEKRFEMGGDPAQCNMMRSIRNDFSGERPHSECFIRFTGGQGRYAVVVRNELSREKFLAFQTDGETWAEIDDYSRTMPMEEAIGRYMERHPSKDRK